VTTTATTTSSFREDKKHGELSNTFHIGKITRGDGQNIPKQLFFRHNNLAKTDFFKGDYHGLS